MKAKSNITYGQKPKGMLRRQFLLVLSFGIVMGSGFTLVIVRLKAPSFFGSKFHHFTSSRPKENISQNLKIEKVYNNNKNEEEKLFKEVRVLCWILTSPKNHMKKAIHVRNTWGQRCNTLLFMSSKADKKLRSIALPNVKEGRKYLWGKTKEAFRYIYEHHFKDAEWFMKADDDTYVIVENLRFLLKDYNSSHPISFGCKSKNTKQMIGGAGYVLSKEALRRFIQIAIPNKKKCTGRHSGDEDFQLSRCLKNFGVKSGDTRDNLGRHRFFQLSPEFYIRSIENKTFNEYFKYSYYYSLKPGLDCCSDTAISFHYITPNEMYVMDYLIYYLQPYGISHSSTNSNRLNI